MTKLEAVKPSHYASGPLQRLDTRFFGEMNPTQSPRQNSETNLAPARRSIRCRSREVREVHLSTPSRGPLRPPQRSSLRLHVGPCRPADGTCTPCEHGDADSEGAAPAVRLGSPCTRHTVATASPPLLPVQAAALEAPQRLLQDWFCGSTARDGDVLVFEFRAAPSPCTPWHREKSLSIV